MPAPLVTTFGASMGAGERGGGVTRGAGGEGRFKGACGVFTCLLLLACEPEVPAHDSAEEAQAPQVVRPAPEEPQPSPPVPSSPQPPPTPVPVPVPVPAEPVGRSWYVSTKGSDGGAGTLEAPLRTIGRAAALAKPGEVIRVLPGVYAEELVLESRGSGVAPITLRGEGAERPRLVPKDRVRGAILRVQGRWNLENLHFDVAGASMFAVLFDANAVQSVLSGSELNGGTAGAGVCVEGARDITVRNNHIHHFIKPGDDSHGVAVVGPARNIVIRDNDIHHNSGDSIQCQPGSGPADGVLIEGNTLHDEGENGVDIKQCLRVTVRDNVLSGFPNTAIRPAGSSAGEAVVIHDSARDILIQGNAISRAGRGVSVLDGSTPPENIAVEDNLLQDIRDVPAGNGQGIRIEGARTVRVVGNTVEGTASYGLMLAADGRSVTGLEVRNNVLRGGSQSLLLRLGAAGYRPGLLMRENQYASGGVLKGDGANFPGEQLILSSPEKLEVWRQVLGVDTGSSVLQ
ncbi:MAG TPA: right-handed parallel beta-helix repeat-containing protein [Archangium sp.]|uniref:right-handed parallel beta-helix repeat-containing protein n=1 Tax=Archangium sp. TaxID=1872627 RepID=UPI002E30CEC8|nr:right-handed parallel beta-helix repeat-containing protein [Archangium sp.]HEX5748263.1 right-handed parallel beta-helix repeat-containing protein [Archangium sp.]